MPALIMVSSCLRSEMEIKAILRLEDAGGKHFEIDLPKTPDGQPILPAEKHFVHISGRDYIVLNVYWHYKADGDIDVTVVAVSDSIMYPKNTSTPYLVDGDSASGLSPISRHMAGLDRSSVSRYVTDLYGKLKEG